MKELVALRSAAWASREVLEGAVLAFSALPRRLKRSVAPAEARPWRAEGMLKRLMRALL